MAIFRVPKVVRKSVEGMNLRTGEPLEPPDKRMISKPGYEKYTPEIYGALLIPLIIGVVWMAYVVIGSRVKPGLAQLSPATNSLVTVLFIFIILYSIFLVVFFLCRRKALKKVKKIKKYKKRKSKRKK